MATEKNTPEIISKVKAQIAETIFVELGERRDYDKLKAASRPTEKGSPEHKAFGEFLEARNTRLGLTRNKQGGIRKDVHQFVVTESGSVKFMLKAEEAKRLLATLETGKIPATEPSKLEAWLASKPEVVKNLPHLANIAALTAKRGEKGAKGGYLYVRKEDIDKLPEGVKVVLDKDGKPEFANKGKGDAQIYVSAETARNAGKVADGKAIYHDLTATSAVLRYNLDVVAHHDPKTNDPIAPIDVIKKIAEGGHKTASSVYVDGKALIARTEVQKDPERFGQAVHQALKESVVASVARSNAVHYARIRGAEAEKSAPAASKGAEVER